jgi:hypothetical protein
MAPIIRLLGLGVAVSFGMIVLIGSPARADPPPWAGKWKHKHRHDDDRDWEYRRGHRRDRDDVRARCGKIMDRLAFNRAKIREIEPSGRHKKALQWYRDDNENARRDLDNCRNGR